MLNGSKLVSGHLFDYESLGVSGEPVYRASSQIRTLIQKELGDDFANLLSVPVRDDQTNAIDWYSSFNGDVTSLMDLPISEQAIIKNLILDKITKINKFSEKLKSYDNPTAKMYANLIKSSVEYPGDECIFLINGAPVIAYWGFSKEIKNSLNANLLSESKKIEAFKDLKLNDKDVVSNLSTSGNLKTSINQYSSSDKIIDENKNFENDLKTENTNTLTESIKKNTFWQRYGWWFLLLLLIGFGLLAAMKGCTNDFPLVQNDNATQEQSLPNSNQPNNRPEEIPQMKEIPQLTKEAMENKDLSIFKGTWYLTSDNIVNVKTDEKIKMVFEFNEEGVGDSIIYENTGNKCQGRAVAKILTDNEFSIQDSGPTCTNGASYSKATARCKVESGINATCQLRSGDREPFEAKFSRKK